MNVVCYDKACFLMEVDYYSLLNMAALTGIELHNYTLRRASVNRLIQYWAFCLFVCLFVCLFSCFVLFFLLLFFRIKKAKTSLSCCFVYL